MAQRKSTGLLNYIACRGSARQALANSRIMIYSGTQPASADAAPNGTLLVTLTLNGNSFIGETLPQWQFTIAGSAGSVTSVKISGIECLSSAVAFNSTLTQTAADVATAINNSFSIIDYTAASSGAIITVTGPVGCGASLNDLTLAVTASTLTTEVASSGAVTTNGVNAINGCNFVFPSTSGVLAKETTVWSGVCVADGTAGWFRIVADASDSLDVSTLYRRLDGLIATSNSDLILNTAAFSTGAVITINSGSFSVT